MELCKALRFFGLNFHRWEVLLVSSLGITGFNSYVISGHLIA